MKEIKGWKVLDKKFVSNVCINRIIVLIYKCGILHSRGDILILCTQN